MRYQSDRLGAEFRDGFFVCEFNTHLVNFTRVMSSARHFSAERTTFFAPTTSTFIPTDVLEDAERQWLLVIDTGGWFRYGWSDVAGGEAGDRRGDLSDSAQRCTSKSTTHAALQSLGRIARTRRSWNCLATPAVCQGARENSS